MKYDLDTQMKMVEHKECIEFATSILTWVVTNHFDYKNRDTH